MDYIGFKLNISNPFIVDTLEVLKNSLNVNETLISLNISNIVNDTNKQRAFY